MKYDITLTGRESANVLDVLNQILYHPQEVISIGSLQRDVLADLAHRMTYNDYAIDHGMSVDEMTEWDFLEEYRQRYEA